MSYRATDNGEHTCVAEGTLESNSGARWSYVTIGGVTPRQGYSPYHNIYKVSLVECYSRASSLSPFQTTFPPLPLQRYPRDPQERRSYIPEAFLHSPVSRQNIFSFTILLVSSGRVPRSIRHSTARSEWHGVAFDTVYFCHRGAVLADQKRAVRGCASACLSAALACPGCAAERALAGGGHAV